MSIGQSPDNTLGSAGLSLCCNRVMEHPCVTLMPSDSISSTLMAGSRGPRLPLGPRRSGALRPALRWPQRIVRQVQSAALQRISCFLPMSCSQAAYSAVVDSCQPAAHLHAGCLCTAAAYC